MARRPYNVLVFDEQPLARQQAVSILKQRDYTVLEAVVREQAYWWLSQWAIDLLIIGTRIAGADGLQFLSSIRAHQPLLQGILIGREGDEGLQGHAWKQGASLLIHPYDPMRFLAVVAVHLSSIRQQQRWPRKPVASQPSVNVNGMQARLLDVSYGGVKFLIDGESFDLPKPIKINVADAGFSVPAELVWSARAADGVSCICGAALTAEAPAQPWRQYVDQLPA